MAKAVVATQQRDATTQQRDALIQDGLAVPCAVGHEHGGLGLQYTGTSIIRPGTVVAIYPAHSGLRPRQYHHNLPPLLLDGRPCGEYAVEMRERLLYASPGRRSAGLINEPPPGRWPNVLFAPVDMDIDQTDEPLSTMLAVMTRRWVKPYDFLWVHYGPEYQVVRQIIGYQLVPPTEQERIRPVFATRTIHHSCQCGCGSHTHAAGPAPPPANVLASIGIDPSPPQLAPPTLNPTCCQPVLLPGRSTPPRRCLRRQCGTPSPKMS